MIEILGGELRIGEELSDAQEILKTWFYSCFCCGVIAFGMVYQCLFFFLVFTWRLLRRRFKRATTLHSPGMENDVYFSDFDSDIGDMDFESVDVSNEIPCPHEHRNDNNTTAQPDIGESDGGSVFDSRVNPCSSAHEQTSVSDLGRFGVEVGSQGGRDADDMGRANAMPSASVDGTEQGRPMRVNEILEEEDGSSSWEDLSCHNLLHVVAIEEVACPAQQYHQENSTSHRGATSLRAGTDLVESLLLGNGHNCSRDVRDGEARSIFSFFSC